MISEGSCDTEDWSNDAENSALNKREKNRTSKYIETELIILKLLFKTVIIFNNDCFYCIFDPKHKTWA